MQIFINSGIATIGATNTAYLTILSNDDPYGIIQFQNVCMLIGSVGYGMIIVIDW